MADRAGDRTRTGHGARPWHGTPARHRARTWLGTLAAGVLLSGAAVAPAGHTAEPPPARDPVPSAPAATAPALGAYLDYGPSGIQRMAGLQKWLGGTKLRAGHTYLPGDVWSNIEGRPEFLEPWTQWRRAREDRLLVLNVPMLVRNEDHLPDPVVRQMLRLGAEGGFDRHFRTLGERLVRLEAPDTVIVLGWEMNGITYTHRCAPDPEAWKAYWRRIVTAMRAVPGQRFRFDFAPSRGTDAVPWTACYPGDDVVDIVGMDSYDQPPGEDFDEMVEQPYGLRHHVEFAAAHGKPVSYPEWGLFRNGDNPEYMRRMLEWIDRHKPIYHTITDYCPHGVWQCDDNPRSSEVFRTALSSGGPEPKPQETAPAPEPPAVEPGPAPDPEPEPEPEQDPAGSPRPQEPSDTDPGSGPADLCRAVDLGPWVRQWLGGTALCLPVRRW
ncbi:glycoside hydrolase family 26 protein [Streptomyces sp. NPDC093595]|uniref:glycoside hydrolase family 26 protein n=1 Tax=Streptomyces sp. NPDC093595 TaxID=3366045 RepID=UPI00380CFDF7